MKPRMLLLRYMATEGCRYAWQSIKNCARRLLGRKPYSDERMVFFRQFLRHLAGVERIWAITCAMDSTFHGPGSRAFFTMWTMSAARACGLTYLHTPFSTVAYPDRPMQDWAAAWESFFHLGAGETPYQTGTRGVINVPYGLQNLEVCFAGRRHAPRSEDCFNAMIPEFRRKYYLHGSPHTTSDVTIAINVRRREVSAVENSYMYTSAEKLLQMATAVKAVLDAQGIPLNLRVYGQGSVADFEQLTPLGAEFHLEADPMWTMRELIEADILLVAKSAFSYYAGIISDGIKIYEEPCKWPSFAVLDDWIPCKADGSLDARAFEHRLSLLLQAKKEAVANALSPDRVP